MSDDLWFHQHLYDWTVLVLLALQHCHSQKVEANTGCCQGGLNLGVLMLVYEDYLHHSVHYVLKSTFSWPWLRPLFGLLAVIVIEIGPIARRTTKGSM